MSDLQPSVIISNGSNGSYHHPRQVTVTAYRGLVPAPTVLQTNKCLRAAPCANVPDAFIADPETVDEDGTIEIEVDAATAHYTARYGTTVRTFPVKAPIPGLLVASSSVVISRLLPNPVGPDDDNETVTVRNTGTVPASLVGWTLKDRSGATWNLSGALRPSQARTFHRNGQPMTLNNAGDEISLVSSVGTEADTVEYSAVKEGELIMR